jgi:flavodoxin
MESNKPKILILYFSFHHKNTEKIAKAMAEVLSADLVEVTRANPEMILSYDLIGFGSGIYAFSHHKSLFEFLKKLNPVQKKAFIFSTSGAPNGMIFHKKLKKELIKKGFEIIGEFNCPGFDTFGPFKIGGGINKGRPNENDIQKAKEFAKKILQNLYARNL